MKKIKGLFLIAVFLAMALFLSGIANATITISEVELDNDLLSASSTNFVRDVERGDSFEVKVHLISDADVDNAQVEAEIRGYDHDDLMDDITDTFDMKTNVTYVKKMTLQLRDRMDQDIYKLRVTVSDRDSDAASQTYELEVDTPSHLLQIKDVIFSPEGEIKAGRALLTTVRVKNMGEKDEEGIKIKVSIPELGISASDYIDELTAQENDDSDDEATSEELYMKIPDNAEAGNYKVIVEAQYDDGDEKVTKEYTIKVKEQTTTAGTTTTTTITSKTIIGIGSESQDVNVGGAAIYPITITNSGTESKVYIISVDTVKGLEAKVSPSNTLVVGAGETQAAYVYVSAKDTATIGDNIFSVTIKSGEDTLKQIPFKAKVTGTGTESAWANMKKGLEIGVLVLVVLLVILGLILGFGKMKKDAEEEESAETKTYY